MRELIAKAHQYSGSTSEKLIMRGMTVVGTLKNNMYKQLEGRLNFKVSICWVDNFVPILLIN